MGYSKVDYAGKTLIDLTSDTVAPNQMLTGVTAHDKAGQLITGTIPNNGSINVSIDPTVVTEYVIPAGYTSGGTIRFVTITHYYYNGVLLPKLPDEVKTYPYCWIRKNNSTGYYDLILSSSKLYKDSSAIKDGGAAGSDIWFRIQISAASSATSWGSKQSHSYSGWTVDANRPVMWSNTDIYSSVSSSTVYFAGSDPVPAT